MADTKTLGMKVENTGFLLDRMGRDCGPLQFVRELTQNAIEAILRTPDKKGTVYWGLNGEFYTLSDNTMYKLCIVDTGDGMTGEDIAKYINSLSSSGGTQSHMENYGVGAKIAAATRNPAGLIYLSWKDGIGSMAQLWRDPTTQNYGLKRFNTGDGNSAFWTRADDGLKPSLIKDHGTVVVLVGETEDANTMLPPANTPQLALWLSKYLNTRYFEFPEGIEVRSQEITIGQVEEMGIDAKNRARVIRGQKNYLAVNSDSSGIVALTNAKAHWWITKDDPNVAKMASYWASSGHTAALYQNELYETTVGRASIAMLQEFGVSLGYQRVIIYVEPDVAAIPGITTDTARSRLLINNESLPWADWATEFRDKMPAEIEALIETASQSVKSTPHGTRMRERLDEVRELLDASMPIKSPTGKTLAGASQGSGFNVNEPTGSGSGGGRLGKPTPPRADTIENILSAFADVSDIAAQRKKAMELPKVQWLSNEDGTRKAGDELEDRAARYIPSLNELHINGDFRVFVEMAQRLCTIHQGKPGIQNIAKETVREWYEQSLVEAVLSAKSLAGSRSWTPDSIKGLLSEEGLTGAVLGGRWLHMKRVANSVSLKIGKATHIKPSDDAGPDVPTSTGARQPAKSAPKAG